MKPEDLDSAVTARVPVFIGKDDRYFNDTFQAIPKYGYTKLFENILDHKNIKIMLNTDSKEVLNIKNEKFYLFGNEFNGKIIFTGQIDEFFDYRFGELPYRSVEMKFETLENDYFQEAATVNYPNNYTFTRITEFKHIHPVTSSKTTILKEYPQQHIQNKTTPYYPIFTEENQLKYQQYKEYSKQFTNLLLLGRLAEYKYYDMDDIVERVLEVIEEIK
jgi:UDP-galactopyranose mutase